MNNDIFKDQIDAAQFARLHHKNSEAPKGDSRGEDEGYITPDQIAELETQLHPGSEDDDV